MSPLDEIVRDQIYAVLKPLGFRRIATRTYALERESGDRAVVCVHPHRMGSYDATFFVEFHVQPKIYRDWLRKVAADSVYGIWQSRLLPPTKPPVGGRDMWALDLDDTAARIILETELLKQLPQFLGYLDLDALIEYVNQPTDALPKLGVAREIGLAMLLTEKGAVSAAQELMARATTSGSVIPSGFDREGFVRFLDNWNSDRP